MGGGGAPQFSLPNMRINRDAIDFLRLYIFSSKVKSFWVFCSYPAHSMGIVAALGYHWGLGGYEDFPRESSLCNCMFFVHHIALCPNLPMGEHSIFCQVREAHISEKGVCL